ncbi:MAG: topoisomerase [Pseudonocardia sp.]|nr:topoisomerase [Pseudonocardia sp.]
MATGTTSSKPAAHEGEGTDAAPARRAGGGSRRSGTPTSAASGRPTRRLVIVESGTKAAKIQKFLGKDYVVEASVGHIRDLPRGAADVPAKHKGEAWARLGVDVDNQFAPLYIITPEKKSKVAELREALKSVDELLLATDPDREGEAIAWHLLDTLKPKVPVRRMVFHEISEPAIRAAVENLRDLDQDMVDAQETRRILDRLYGYEVSPVLWKKVMPKLSAGRVQSVATRIVVARERERMAFVSASYWDIAAQMDAGALATPRQFPSRLVAIDGERVATGRDFGADGRLKTTGRDPARALDEASARRLAEALQGRDLTVESVESKPYTRKPYAPFMTSTLQQEAGRKLRFSADRTMRSAQRLYENGYITYLRTDSTTLSESAINAARSQARELYGDAYVPAQPRQYTRKVKNAQEAHEAIRPAGDTFRTPGEIAREVDGDDFRLYELIWQRTVASQMADARGTTVSIRIAGTAATGEAVTFASSGRTITFPGFLKAYVETVDDQAGGEADDAESRLPELTQGQALTAASLTPEGHSTNPPSRFTEPSLIKQLEDLGIGRPSTYASIIKTIQDRGYVWKKGQALVPSWIAFAVIGLMEHHFGRLVDYDFTATMEDELDAIAHGTQQRTNWLTGFYFGADQGSEGSVARAGGLKKLVGVNLEEIDAREINSVQVFDDVVVRVGRYGPYLERVRDGQSQRANLPDDLPPDELTREVAEQLFSVPQEGRSLGVDPVTGHEIVAKEGRYGPYVTEILPEPEEPVEEPAPAPKTTRSRTAAVTTTSTTAKAPARKKAVAKPKPRTGSLFKGMSTETVTLEDALRLLSLPRLVGNDPESGDEITAQNGRYGPYLKKGTDSRSLTDEEQLFTVTLDEALEIYKQPKQRGRRTAAATPPLRELGTDANTKKPMVIKDGRFGPYVTDGETNASLRKGDSVEQLTDERASELLAERRARGPAPKKTTAARKPAARKPAAKKAPAK